MLYKGTYCVLSIAVAFFLRHLMRSTLVLNYSLNDFSQEPKKSTRLEFCLNGLQSCDLVGFFRINSC